MPQSNQTGRQQRTRGAEPEAEHAQKVHRGKTTYKGQHLSTAYQEFSSHNSTVKKCHVHCQMVIYLFIYFQVLTPNDSTIPFYHRVASYTLPCLSPPNLSAPPLLPVSLLPFPLPVPLLHLSTVVKM